MWHHPSFNKKPGVVTILLVLLPISFMWLAWLADVFWWINPQTPQEDRENYNNLKFQLGNNEKLHCPAKLGLELEDYWECLWRSTITPKGRQQHERILWQVYNERVKLETVAGKMVMDLREEILQVKFSNKTGRNDDDVNVKVMVNGKGRRRKRRQAIPKRNDSDPRTFYTYLKVFYTVQDLGAGLSKVAAECQQEVQSGVSIHTFLNCLKRGAKAAGLGKSLDPTFQPTPYPPINESEYPPNEYQLPSKMVHQTTGVPYKLRYDFQPLGREENLQNFWGADPYLESDFSVYRYRYNNLNTRQNNPSWTYRGINGALEWHILNLDKFYVPIRKNGDLSNVEVIAEFPQTYPGMGVLVPDLKELVAPFNPKWSKDSGYTAYTRFLLPFLEKYDLDYYKKRGLIDSAVTPIPDTVSLQGIINAIDKFQNDTQDYIFSDPLDKSNPKFASEKDAPFANAYLDFIRYFIGVDTGAYKTLKSSFNGTVGNERGLFWEMEQIRTLLRKYVAVVRTKQSCMREMIMYSQDRGDKVVRWDDAEHENEFDELLIKTAGSDPSTGCLTAPDRKSAITENKKPTATGYTMNAQELKALYKNYFQRRESRQRYMLPKFPVRYPLCKNTEPSPIDIRVDRGRESSIRDYHFGRAAYSLQRFFMFFPLDGSPLLTVGIVDAERLDGSAILLTGGAVKADTNLTLQYIHFHYASDWKQVGSEHWINGKGAAMEMQMIFTISGSADPIKYWHVLSRVQNQLFQFREKLVVILSVLVDVLPSEQDVINKIEQDDLNQDPYAFEALAQAAYHFRKMPQKYPSFEEPRGYVSTDPVFRFIDLLPQKPTNFYTYRGSLSYPPCFGYVIRSVFEQRLYMTKHQFDQFVGIPAYGVQQSSFAFDNFRRFDDIYVEQENTPDLKFEYIQAMVKERTVDRFILNGHHGVLGGDGDDAHGKEHGLVAEEMYYMDSKGVAKATVTKWLCILITMQKFGIY